MSASHDQVSAGPKILAAGPQSKQAPSESHPSTTDKPIVVGLYGVPGSGKTFLLNQLEQELGEERFAFYDGSKVIASVVPGGLDAFQKLEEHEKVHWRQSAIEQVGKQCTDSGHVAIVAAYLTFWSEGDASAVSVYTQKDLETFTHIFYLNVSADLVAQRRQDDKERHRPSFSIDHLCTWQEEEKLQLQRLCRAHGILFCLVSPGTHLLSKVSMLLRDFAQHSESYNLKQVEKRLDEILVGLQAQPETMLVFDADDKTLAAEDVGALFWQKLCSTRSADNMSDPLKALFSSPLRYSYTAFRQATLLYEEAVNDEEFDGLCREVASIVTMHPEFVHVLQLAAEKDHVGAVVVTCGLRRVCELVLESEGLSESVKVIGGGRTADGFVVTAAVKAAVVARLQADQAVVVVGKEQTRSKTMDAALSDAIDNGGFRARQILLPGDTLPRLDTARLPLIQITDPDFVHAILFRRSRYLADRVLHATERSTAKLLMTPMRDARVAGPALRAAHRQVGWYLAVEFLADRIGTEMYAIPHVQGGDTDGHRLQHEEQTTIVALMRGGEPMAFGVHDAFPLAMFVHAKAPEDLERHHLQGQRTVILADSVVNSGKSVVDFIQHIRGLDATIRIVIVAGVLQAGAVSGGCLAQTLARDANISLVALRLSENKFTGTKTVDTGNRLFNTTHLE